MQMRLFESATVTADDRSTRLVEYARAGITAEKVDRERGVIRDVKLLGRSSTNNREYTPEARRKAVTLYEGCRVRIDHKPEQTERSLLDGIGILKGIYEQGESVFAKEFVLIKSHPLFEFVMERAEKFPNTFGFSHDSHGVVQWNAGQAKVIDLVSVDSVDLVEKPATNTGLFESHSSAPDFLSDDDVDGIDQLLDVESDDTDDGASDFEKGLKAIVRAIVGNMSDRVAVIDALRDAFTTHDDIAEVFIAAIPRIEPDDPRIDKSSLTEMVQRATRGILEQLHESEQMIAGLQKQLQQSHAKSSAHQLFEAAGVKPTALQLQAASAMNDHDRLRFVDELRESQSGSVFQVPRSSGAGADRPSDRSNPFSFREQILALRGL